jgi:undecaprenyl-diphosphatase
MAELNWSLFEDVNGTAGHGGILDHIMVFAANDLIFVLPLLALLFWFALARWSPLLRNNSQADSAAMVGHVTLVLTAVAAVIALGLNILLAHLIFEPRPFVSHPKFVHTLIAHAADASFPSDHSAAAFAIATAAVAIAFARVYVGVHYPGDVIGGALCGIIGALIALALTPLVTPLLTPIIRALGQVGLA